MKTAHVLLWQEHGMWHGHALEINASGDAKTLDGCERALAGALRHKAHIARLGGEELEDAPDWVEKLHAGERWQRWFRGVAPADFRSATGYENIDWLVRDGGERDA